MSKIAPDDLVTRGLLGEAVDVILNGMDKMVGEWKNEMNSRFDKMESRLNGLEVEVRGVKDEVRGLKAEFSVTPTRREFEELKARVDKYHPLI